MRLAQCAELLVEPLGVAAAKIRDVPDTQVREIACEAWPDAGNALKVFQRSGGLVIV